MAEKGFYLLEADMARQIYIKEDSDLAPVGHFHEGIEIVAILEGEVEAYCLTNKDRLKAGEIFFADSFMSHYYRKITPEIKAIVLVLSSEYTSTFHELYAGKTFSPYMVNKEKNRAIINVMRHWLEEEKKTFMLNVGYSNLLFSKIVENYEMETTDKKQKDKGVSIKLLRYINDHYTEDISLTAISKEIGYSKEYCSKIFAEVVGMSFRDYLNFLRLKKANEYFAIKKGLKMTTTEIVYKCGFNSTATFYRTQKAFAQKNIKI